MKTWKFLIGCIVFFVASSQANANEEYYKYISEFKTRLFINMYDKEIVIQDSVLDFDFCGKFCIQTDNLSLAKVDTRKSITFKDFEFRTRNEGIRSLLGFRCEMIDVYEGDTYLGEYCYSEKRGVVAFRMNKIESGKWFYLEQERGIFSAIP